MRARYCRKSFRWRVAPVLFMLAGIACLTLADPAVARPAGDTRTGYDSVLEVESYPVHIHYNEGDERVARRIGKICEERLDELAGQLGGQWQPAIDIEVIDDVINYRRTHGDNVPDWGVAFAVMGQGRMVVDVQRATRAWNSLEEIIPHELSHLLAAERLRGVPVPVWFLEGLAQWQAGQWTIVDGFRLMNEVWSRKVPKLWHLQNSYPAGEDNARAAYRVSYTAFAYLFGENLEALPQLFEAIVEAGDFNSGFTANFGENPMTFYVRFHEHLDAKYHSWLLVFQDGPLFSVLAIMFLVLAVAYHIRKRKRIRDMPDGAGGV